MRGGRSLNVCSLSVSPSQPYTCCMSESMASYQPVRARSTDTEDSRNQGQVMNLRLIHRRTAVEGDPCRSAWRLIRSLARNSLTATVALVVTRLFSGCALPNAFKPSKAPPLHAQGDGGGGFEVLAPNGESRNVSFGAGSLCADDHLTVTSITPVHVVGGASISDWGSRAFQMSSGGSERLGAEPKPLATLGFKSGPVTFGPSCQGAAGKTLEFAVVVKRGSRPAVSSYVDGLRVNYSSAGENLTLDLPYRFGFCGVNDPNTPPPRCLKVATNS